METFSHFSTISPHHKWNGTRLLSPESVRVASRLAERLKTYDLRKLGNLKKIAEMLGFDGECPAVQPKAKFWLFFGKKLQKISCKTFHRKSYLAKFLQLVINLLSNTEGQIFLAWQIYSCWLTFFYSVLLLMIKNLASWLLLQRMSGQKSEWPAFDFVFT